MGLLARFAMTRNQTPIVATEGLAQKDWYIFFYNLYLAVTEGMPQAQEVIPIGASPFVYISVIKGQMHIAGGTVSLVEFSRDGTNWFGAGITAGFVTMDARDQLRITYTVAPTLNYFPM